MNDAVVFDAEAIREASAAPVFQDGARRTEGRILSIVEFWPHLDWWRRWGAGEIKDPEGWVAGLRLFLEAVFPPSLLERVAARLPRWAPLRRSVADTVLALPLKAQQEAAAFFFGSLVSAHFNVEQLLSESTPEPGPATSGTTSGETTTVLGSDGPAAT